MMVKFSSIRSIFFCCVVLAATVLQAKSEDDSTVDVPTDAPTQFRCSGICGDEEGNLENPDTVVSYQWNARVPVCAGLSCDTDSCSNLEEKLGLLELTDFECTRHRLNLQDIAGCTCSEPKPRPPKRDDTIPVKTEKISSGPSHEYNWILVGVVAGLYLLIWIGCWLGVRHDDKIEAEQKQAEENEEP